MFKMFIHNFASCNSDSDVVVDDDSWEEENKDDAVCVGFSGFVFFAVVAGIPTLREQIGCWKVENPPSEWFSRVHGGPVAYGIHVV